LNFEPCAPSCMARSSRNSRWIQITIFIDPRAQEALSDYLFEMGTEGLVVLDKPVPGIRAYLSAKLVSEERLSGLQEFLETLSEIFPGMPPPEFRVQGVEDQDWDLMWRRFFKPEQVTPRLMVLPPWEALSSPFPGHLVKIDPGPAFGTGRHATTRMCLKALEDNVPEEEWSLVDVGTGSGILAIYASILGAQRVLAIDTDPEAAGWAKRNIGLNGLAGQIEVSTLPLDSLEEQFSMLVANITLKTIVGLVPIFPPRLSPGGKAILSGILQSQVEDLEDCLQRSHLHLLEILSQEEWACVIARHVGRAGGGDGV